MATPGYTPTVGDRPSDQSKLRVGTTADSFGANVGEAMDNLGRGVQRAANVFAAVEREKSASRNRTEDVGFQNDIREITHGPEGYFAQTGVNALDESRETYEEGLRRALEQRALTIKNKNEREAFLATGEQRIADLLDSAARHEMAQAREASVQSRESARLSAEENALSSWADDEAFERNLAEALAHSTDLGNFVGATPEEQALILQQQTSNLIRSRAILMADKDPVRAQEYIDNEERLTETHRRELTENIEPLVRSHRAEQLVQRHTVTQSTPQGDFKARLFGAELGNLPDDTVNRGVSGDNTAGGPGGFTVGTWREHLTFMERAGRMPMDISAMTDEERMRLRFDRNFVSKAADVWIERLDGALRAIGAPLTDGNRYMMHHMGFGGGTWLMTAAPNALARDVYAAQGQLGAWEAAVRENPNMFTMNMSAGQVIQKVHGHIGKQSGVSAPDGVVGFDAAAAYDEANRIEDPKEREVALSAVAAREAAIAAQRQAASGQIAEEARERYLTTGNADLSLTEKLTLGGVGIQNFESFVQRDRANSLADNPTLIANLQDMFSSPNRQTQTELTAPGYLEQFMSEMTRPQYDAFVAQRAVLRGELEGQKMTVEQIVANPEAHVKITPEYQREIDTYLNPLLTGNEKTEAGRQKNATLRTQLTNRVRREVADFLRANGGRSPSETEFANIMAAITAPTVTEGSGFLGFGQTKQPAWLAAINAADGDVLALEQDYDKVPADVRSNIAAMLLTTRGAQPTEEEIAQVYNDFVQLQGGQAIAGDVDLLPEGAVEAGAANNLSPEEVAEAYTAYLMGVMRGEIDPIETPFMDVDLALPAVVPQEPEPEAAMPDEPAPSNEYERPAGSQSRRNR